MNEKISRRNMLKQSVGVAVGVVATPEMVLERESLTRFGPILVSGVPEAVDANHVDHAEGGFSSSIKGMEHVVAEPGGLLFEPFNWFMAESHDIGEYTRNQDKHQYPFNELNHGLITAQPEAGLVVPANGLTLLNCGGGRFEMPVEYSDNPAVIALPSNKGVHYILVVKGKFADMGQDTGRNTPMTITDYQAGSVEFMHFNPGQQNNTPFVSEGQFRQITNASHTVAANSGPAGAHEVVAVGFDVNTGALSVVRTANERFTDPSKIDYSLLKYNWS